VANFARNYGDLLGVLTTLEKGGELVHIPTRNEEISAEIDEQIERVPTQHDEMQWRLIRLAGWPGVTSGSRVTTSPRCIGKPVP